MIARIFSLLSCSPPPSRSLSESLLCRYSPWSWVQPQRGSAEQAVIWNEQSKLCVTKMLCKHFRRLGTWEFLVAEPALTESLAASSLLCGREFVGVCLMVQKATNYFNLH